MERGEDPFAALLHTLEDNRVVSYKIKVIFINFKNIIYFLKISQISEYLLMHRPQAAFNPLYIFGAIFKDEIEKCVKDVRLDVSA